MFIAINRITVVKDKGDDVEKRFAESSGLEDMQGFVQFRLVKRTWSMGRAEADDEYLSMTEWDSMDDFMNWTKSETFRKAHAGPKSEFIIGAAPAGYDVIVERS